MGYAPARGSMEAVAASEEAVRRSRLHAEDCWLEFEQVTWDVWPEVGPGEDAPMMPAAGVVELPRSTRLTLASADTDEQEAC